MAKALADVGAVYLKADWTNHDAQIAKLLAEHGRAGVPLYLVYGSGGGDPAVLPQLLTPGAVAQAIRARAEGINIRDRPEARHARGVAVWRSKFARTDGARSANSESKHTRTILVF